MKWKMEEEKILASVSKQMESEGATSASSFLAALNASEQQYQVGKCNWLFQTHPQTFRGSIMMPL
jgi:hypothetical protein